MKQRLIVVVFVLQHSQRDFKPPEAAAAGSAAAQPQRSHGLWSENVLRSFILYIFHSCMFGSNFVYAKDVVTVS